MRIVEPSAMLLWITPEPYIEIERAGRTCYKSEDRITPVSAITFCEMIKKKGHESVVEHAVASFRIVCDRGVSHEIVRHRIASYSQESTRYCNYNKEKFGSEISVIQPPGIEPCERYTEYEETSCNCDKCNIYSAWHSAVIAAEVRYKHLIEKGVSPQIARSVLPTCLKTELVMTANFREWMHFINLRTSTAAHPQIRPLAESIRIQLAQYCPTIFPKPDPGAKTITFLPEERTALLHALQIDGEINPTAMSALVAAMEKLK